MKARIEMKMSWSILFLFVVRAFCLQIFVSSDSPCCVRLALGWVVGSFCCIA